MNDQPAPKLRTRNPLLSGGYVIVRGADDRELTREQAMAFRVAYPGMGAYGVSGFYARSAQEIGVLCQTKLDRWEVVHSFTIEDVIAAGLIVAPTFRTPHVTIAHSDLDQLLTRLNRCPHETIQNRYHEG